MTLPGKWVIRKREREKVITKDRGSKDIPTLRKRRVKHTVHSYKEATGDLEEASFSFLCTFYSNPKATWDSSGLALALGLAWTQLFYPKTTLQFCLTNRTLSSLAWQWAQLKYSFHQTALQRRLTSSWQFWAVRHKQNAAGDFRKVLHLQEQHRPFLSDTWFSFSYLEWHHESGSEAAIVKCEAIVRM